MDTFVVFYVVCQTYIYYTTEVFYRTQFIAACVHDSPRLCWEGGNVSIGLILRHLPQPLERCILIQQAQIHSVAVGLKHIPNHIPSILLVPGQKKMPDNHAPLHHTILIKDRLSTVSAISPSAPFATSG